MPRGPRLDASGTLHHVMVRGIERKAVLRNVIVIAATMCLLGAPAGRAGDVAKTAAATVAQDVLFPPEPGAVKMEGALGKKIDLCIANRVLAEKWDTLVEPFRKRDGVAEDWRGEFWGKWVTSAALARSYADEPRLRSAIDESVKALIATQAKDGYLGVHKDGQHMTGYDLWNRKYVLLGLLSYYDLTGDKAALESVQRCADSILAEVGPGKVSIMSGPNEKMANGTVLEPMVLLYRRAGEKRYLEFANYIVNEWSGRKKWVERAIADPSFTGEGHAYVFMSCFEGICELYRATGEKKYLDAARNMVSNIAEQEIFIVGSGSTGEHWFKGRSKQTQPVDNPMETCATVTWLKLCFQMLRLTGDPKIADEMERTTYNALLGAMKPDGSWWCYFTPLAGVRKASGNQVGMPLSCCVANGPRGMLLIPSIAVMKGVEGPVVNLYCQGSYTVALNSGNRARLVQETDYPASGAIRISLHPTKPEEFTLKLRIPSWSEQATLAVAGAPWAGTLSPNTYVAIKRTWKEGDTIDLNLDMRGKLVADPGGSSSFAVMRGPIVLAMDKRLWKGNAPDAISVKREAFPIELALRPRTGDTNLWLVCSVPATSRVGGKDRDVELPMCDYASAGNTWDASSKFRVWLSGVVDMAEPMNLEGASWLWHESAAGLQVADIPGGTNYFRSVLTLPEGAGVNNARIAATADNMFTLYVNGTLVGKSGRENDSWRKPEVFSLIPTLKPGRNTIAVEAVNSSRSAAGLIAKIVVTPATGDKIVLTTGPEWKCSDKAAEGWQKPDFDDRAWPKATVVGKYGGAPWGKVEVGE